MVAEGKRKANEMREKAEVRLAELKRYILWLMHTVTRHTWEYWVCPESYRATTSARSRSSGRSNRRN